MVIKGKARRGAAELAKHLQRTDTNERMEILELRGVAAADLGGALEEMAAIAAQSRTARPFYHASINTRADERLTEAQRLRAIDRLEQELGLTGQPRAVVVHLKKDREHTHVVWSRVDAETMLSIPDSFNYRKHEIVARELEREFGHARVQGVHVERDGAARPERTLGVADQRQAERSGLSPAEIKERVTELWRTTDSGKAFASALAENGFILARGDKRDFVFIDGEGETHSLARRIEGIRAAEVRERMSGLDPANLPSVAEARALWRERQRQALERETVETVALSPLDRINRIVNHTNAIWEKAEQAAPPPPEMAPGGTREEAALNPERDLAPQPTFRKRAPNRYAALIEKQENPERAREIEEEQERQRRQERERDR